jgi:hypothetical protein
LKSGEREEHGLLPVLDINSQDLTACLNYDSGLVETLWVNPFTEADLPLQPAVLVEGDEARTVHRGEDDSVWEDEGMSEARSNHYVG